MYEKYSVLMSVYYKEKPRYLEESIESMLHQTVKPDQIVIVKDGQLTKMLDGILNKYKEKYPNLFEIIELEENSGLGIALNIGLKHCRNDIVARMDSDDISKSTRCQKQLKVLKKNKELAVIGTMVDEFSGNIDNIISSRILPTEYKEITKFIGKRNPINHPTVMFRKKYIEQVGGYVPFKFFEDYYLWARLVSNNMKMQNINESLVFMRVDQGLYSRRGGIKYWLDSCKLRIKLYNLGVASKLQVIVGILGQGAISLMPVNIRKYIYIYILRKI